MGDAVSSLVNANMLKASKHVLIMSKLIIPSPFLFHYEQHWHSGIAHNKGSLQNKEVKSVKIFRFTIWVYVVLKIEPKSTPSVLNRMHNISTKQNSNRSVACVRYMQGVPKKDWL